MSNSEFVLNALYEGRVSGVIEAVEYLEGCPLSEDSKKKVVEILKNKCGFSDEDVSYWISWFNVK